MSTYKYTNAHEKSLLIESDSDSDLSNNNNTKRSVSNKDDTECCPSSSNTRRNRRSNNSNSTRYFHFSTTHLIVGAAAFVVLQFLLVMTMRAGDKVCSSSSSSSNSNNNNNMDSISPSSSTSSLPPSTRPKYQRVQGMGFQIYTGGAPAYLNSTATDDDDVKGLFNPECIGRASYGQTYLEDEEVIQCYIGNDDPYVDVQQRLVIMQQAVERAHELADDNADVLKVFIAPEFFWRGIRGAYVMEEEDAGDPTTCGPICKVLKGLEAIVADERYENWLFLMGTVIAYEKLPAHQAYDYLFYNFAPIYKGYNPAKMDHTGKRFLAPKRYVSTSDFMTPARFLNTTIAKELVQHGALLNNGQGKGKHWEESLDYEIIFNPHDDRQKYDNDVWENYRGELNGLGYALLEYGWLVVDGLSVSIEICLDHQMHTALNTYLADMSTGRQTLIPSSSDEHGLEYVHIPAYQAQVSIVSSAGMTIIPESLALTNDGMLFLQDGLSNATNRMYWGEDECEYGLQFKGGTEAVQRRALLSSTDIFFEHKAVETFRRHDIFDDWETTAAGIFSAKVYDPQMTVFDPMPIPLVV